MNLSDSEAKMKIVDRLIKDGHIDFAEAIELLKKEEVLNVGPLHWDHPYNPFPQINPMPIWHETPFVATCNSN